MCLYQSVDLSRSILVECATLNCSNNFVFREVFVPRCEIFVYNPSSALNVTDPEKF